MIVFRPSDAAETEQVVSWASAERQALDIVAGGSKRGLGRPAAAHHTLDLSAINGIVDYDPAEPVLAVKAATPMAVIGEQLDAQGRQVRLEPKRLLVAAGFTVVDVPEGHLCCGSAGIYNLLQPEIAGQLRGRKVANIQRTKPDLVAAGNIGCITQIASGIGVPVVHTVELLDWATGGPKPSALLA